MYSRIFNATPDRHPTIDVDIRQHIAQRHAARGLSRHDQPFDRLVDDAHARHRAGHIAGSIRAGIVDHDEVVGRPGLRLERVETRRKVPGFVVGADDHGDCQRHRGLPAMVRRIRWRCNGLAAVGSHRRELIRSKRRRHIARAYWDTMPQNPHVPAVSIVIPAFRASRDIPDALASAFSQAFTDFEVILVNDGSPDTPELEQAIAPFRDRLQYIVQENRGAGAARNAGIRAARGRYVAFLDADDVWYPEFLRRQVWYLDANPTCDLVYTDALITGDSPLRGRRFMADAPSRGPVTLLSLISQECNIALSTVVVRRRRLTEAGLFDVTLRRGQDFELWLRLALRGCEMAYTNAVLAERRVRASGLSGDRITEIARALNVLERFSDANPLPVEARTAFRVRTMMLVDQLEIEQGKRRLLEGNYAAARYHLAAPRRPSLKLRAAVVALQVAPGLVRRVYRAMRTPLWPVTAAMARAR
jgi:glycosyltransferase involved in cell wall biosynthesis